MNEIKHSDHKLFDELSLIIEQSKKLVAINVNSTLTLTYWHIGKKINAHLLQNKRAEYGKQIVPNVASKLVVKYGRNFDAKNLRRMIQFAVAFPDFEIVVPLERQLSWSHFIVLIPLKEPEKRLFYAQKSIESSWGKRELKRQIERKVYERTEIAKIQNLLSIQNNQPETLIFKDPYFLDFLGLKEGYPENDLESAIIKELENFILEPGVGFSLFGNRFQLSHQLKT